MLDDKTSRTARLRAALLWISPVIVIVAAIVAYSASTSKDSKSPNSSAGQMQTISMPLEGMVCVSCAARVKRTLKGMEGVQDVEVNLERREALVRFSPEKITPERMESAINALGYKAGKSRAVESQ